MGVPRYLHTPEQERNVSSHPLRNGEQPTRHVLVKHCTTHSEPHTHTHTHMYTTYLWVSLLLKIGNDRLANKFGIPHHVQHLQRHRFLCRLTHLPVCIHLHIHSHLFTSSYFRLMRAILNRYSVGSIGEDPGLTLSVQTIYTAPLHHGDVDG